MIAMQCYPQITVLTMSLILCERLKALTIRRMEHTHTESLARPVDTLELKLFPALALPATTRFSLNFLTSQNRYKQRTAQLLLSEIR